MKKTKTQKNKYCPDLYYTAFWEIDFELLAKRGIKNLIIDVDSTIAHNYSEEIDPRAKEALMNALCSGVISKACLVSNVAYKGKREERVARMAQELNIPYVAAKLFSLKPNPKPFIEGLKLMSALPEETAVIGDQIFTDIKGGNKLGMMTVLVKPLGKVHWLTILSLKRYRESRLLKKFGVQLCDNKRMKES